MCDCNNLRRGPQGEQGPQGPAGPQGPQGPPGSVEDIKTYTTEAEAIPSATDISIGSAGASGTLYIWGHFSFSTDTNATLTCTVKLGGVPIITMASISAITANGLSIPIMSYGTVSNGDTIEVEVTATGYGSLRLESGALLYYIAS